MGQKSPHSVKIVVHVPGMCRTFLHCYAFNLYNNVKETGLVLTV